jgi:prephenate dehydratase
VPDAYELLLASDLQARGETLVHIDHVLAAAKNVAFGRVRRALSHPVALAQCHRFFRTHPAIVPVPVFDTAGAVALAMQDERGDTAAVASRRAAALHGAAVIAEDIQDHSENWTRFLLLAPPDTPRSALPARTNKAILTFRLAHQPGALVRALEPLARRHLNLTKIESRPIHGEPFEYVFIVEAVAEEAVEELLVAVENAREQTRSLRVLGVFPVDERT